MPERLIELFSDLVRIDSESGEEERFLRYLSGVLVDQLGAECVLDTYGNLIARIPGKNTTRKKPLLFACHGDTVKPGKGIDPIVEGDIIRSKGNTILGADDKAGIAQFIEAVRTADTHPPFEFVVTREEETGLLGARHLDFNQLSAKEGIVLDMDALNAVVVGGPTHFLIDMTFHGKAAHAAMEPEKGVSAILAAAHAIAAMPLGRLEPDTTANVGIIKGGQIRNGIPENAHVSAECRSLRHERAVELASSIEQICAESAEAIGATVEVKSEIAYRASSVDESALIVAEAKEAVRSIGLEPVVQTICGGTDASIYNEHGITTVVLGMGVRAEHSTDECIAISDMEKAVDMLHFLFAHHPEATQVSGQEE